MVTKWKNTLKNVLSRRAIRALLFLGAVAAMTALCVTVYFSPVVQQPRNARFESLVVPDYLDSHFFGNVVRGVINSATEPFQTVPPTFFADVTYDTPETRHVGAFSVEDEYKRVRSGVDIYDYDRLLLSYRRGTWTMKGGMAPEMLERLNVLALPRELTVQILFSYDYNEMPADERTHIAAEAAWAVYEIFRQTAPLPRILLEPDSPVLDYYAVSDTRSFGEIPNGGAEFPRSEYHVIYENGRWDFGAALRRSLKATDIHWIPSYDLYLTLDGARIEESRQAWSAGRALLLPYLHVSAALFFLLLLLVTLLCVGAGRTADGGTRRFFPDLVWGECHLLLLCVGLPGLFLLVMVTPYNTGAVMGHYYEQFVMPWVVGVTAAAVFIPWLAVFLSMVRQIKDGRFFTHSLIGWGLRLTVRFFRALVSWRPWAGHPPTKQLFRRQLIYICLGVMAVILTASATDRGADGMILLCLFMVPGTVWYVLANRRTYREITRGFDASLAEQLKAEKMKAALVTNVSHDLKTPLTSLVGYIELLSREEGLSDTARDYVSVLEEKAERLRHLLVDLFDLSKSTSGDIALELETLDLKKLIEQTVADMRDSLDASSLVLRLRLPEHPVALYADGRKLYRVLQNLLDNALKYAQPGTRVYVDLEAEDDSARVIIRNTAGYEMNFTKEEILQRFARGDVSRATEGSGLGLSIAESFARLCGGRLDVDIDGDLFKVTVTFAAR